MDLSVEPTFLTKFIAIILWLVTSYKVVRSMVKKFLHLVESLRAFPTVISDFVTYSLITSID